MTGFSKSDGEKDPSIVEHHETMHYFHKRCAGALENRAHGLSGRSTHPIDVASASVHGMGLGTPKAKKVSEGLYALSNMHHALAHHHYKAGKAAANPNSDFNYDSEKKGIKETTEKLGNTFNKLKTTNPDAYSIAHEIHQERSTNVKKSISDLFNDLSIR